MDYFLILLNQNYLFLNGDQCYVVDRKTTQEITDECVKINGYLPKYRDMIIPQGDQGTLFDILTTLESERELAKLDGPFHLTKPNPLQDKASAAFFQRTTFSYGLCEHRNIGNWSDTHELYGSRREKYVTFELDLLSYTATRDKHGKLIEAPHETGQIIAQTYCRESGRFQLFRSLKPFRRPPINRKNARITYYFALLLCERLLSSQVGYKQG